jgi:hypothetical protein
MMATSNCGGYDVSGIYSVIHGNALSERITNTGTPYAPPKPFVAGKVTFVTANDFLILDGGFTYTFHRSILDVSLVVVVRDFDYQAKSRDIV